MPDLSWLGPVLPTLIVAVLGLVGVLSAATISSYSQWRSAGLQSRELSFAQIMGRKFVVTQLYVSRFEARIFSDYHERRWNLQGCPKESLDFDEARRWMQKSEDLGIEVAKGLRELFESIGVAKASFKRSSDLETLTNRVFAFRPPMVNGPPAGVSLADLDAWKATAVSQLEAIVDTEYAQPINKLLDYLHAHIDE
jgi:hypothetical protein